MVQINSCGDKCDEDETHIKINLRFLQFPLR